MKQYMLILTTLLSLHIVATANSYAVQLGIFLEPRMEDFQPIRTLGFVYAENTEGNVYRVYLGDFSTRREAQQMTNRLKDKGYMDAFVVETNFNNGQNAPVIQLATRAMKERIKWSPFFDLDIPIYVVSDNNKVKIVTAPFRSLDKANARLSEIKRKGFADAFVKNYNTMQMHRVGAFELGNEKQPLIPIDIVEGRGESKEQVRNVSRKGTPVSPPSYGYADERKNTATDAAPAPTPNTTTSSNTTTIAVPRIRTNVKRRSVLNLQKVLKQLEAYEGSLDGYYGKGTSEGFEAATNSNLKFQQYSLLAEYTDLKAPDDANNKEQVAINNLWEDSERSFATLRASKKPIAGAYSAYWLYVTDGKSSGVNTMMNDAVGQAFMNTSPTERPPLDPKATYDYKDLEQLIRHLVFIDQIDKSVKLPCWLLERHPNEARSALISIGGMEASSIEGCYSFDQWEIVQVLQTLALDLNASERLDAKRIDQAASARAQLYLAPSSLDQAELEQLLAWDTQLWEKLETWATSDPLHRKLLTPLQLAYFQTQVQLEDHYMDRDFGPAQAKGLSLAVLQSLVGYHLERF